MNRRTRARELLGSDGKLLSKQVAKNGQGTLPQSLSAYQLHQQTPEPKQE